jgi:hypothetical protein
MENIIIPFDQAAWLYIIVINIVLGFLFGTFPLLLGIKMNNRKYGIYGFIGALIGGSILGVFLSYPIAAVLTWLILKKSSVKESNDTLAVNENPVEAEIDNTGNH